MRLGDEAIASDAQPSLAERRDRTPTSTAADYSYTPQAEDLAVADRDQPSSIGGAIDDVIVITGKLVWTLFCALIALVALGILVVITLAIVRV